ncbi:hypothetical protein JMJ35_005725 [Cladonia borealis]|uniref:BTB domain-containing protein n=1 Tax=Cladonia borealis TaxID=184061 RepID=A0AA39V864_9LECA|nr:hypothetical protein JMJ35_005725 [Cladonia borealis]
MKRKASKQLSKRSKVEGGSTQVASLVTEIDPGGDLQMDLVDRTNDSDGQLRGLLVSKHTLRLSSPVFRTMLADDSPFHESRDKTINKNGIQVIHFKEDDVALMEIIMNAIHLQNHRVPITLTIAQLEELAIVCDKYDIRCLRPWAEMWSRPYVDERCSSLTRLLFVATVFRLADWFVRLTHDLVLRTTSSSEGELLLDDSSRFREGVPQSTLDRIAERRTEVISQMLELCWQDLRQLRSVRGYCGEPWRLKRERQDCDLINLGIMSLHFPDLSGSPLDAVDLSAKSANGILLSIRELTRRSDITITDDRFTAEHGSCCIGNRLSFHADDIINSVDGIELEALASGLSPQKPAQLSQLSKVLEGFETMSDAPAFEVVMRLTAVPNNTNFWREITAQGQARSDTNFAWCPNIKCTSCPGFEYSLFQHPNDELVIHMALGQHFGNVLHHERDKRRLPARSR